MANGQASPAANWKLKSGAGSFVGRSARAGDAVPRRKRTRTGSRAIARFMPDSSRLSEDGWPAGTNETGGPRGAGAVGMGVFIHQPSGCCQWHERAACVGRLPLAHGDFACSNLPWPCHWPVPLLHSPTMTDLDEHGRPEPPLAADETA